MSPYLPRANLETLNVSKELCQKLSQLNSSFVTRRERRFHKLESQLASSNG